MMMKKFCREIIIIIMAVVSHMLIFEISFLALLSHSKLVLYTILKSLLWQ